MYPDKPNLSPKPNQSQERSSTDIKFAQIQYVMGEMSKRIQGLMFGFDSYIKMKGDDESLNDYIKKSIIERKEIATKENTKNESTRSDSKSSNTKPVGNVSQDRPS